ncbi:MAG TPA: methyltransferase domain-containing protein [Bacteriovoracaceae bacterium]|nr:methyltransferase domain-containing protein [Bacteriovoracaceae bacterium]
MRLLLSATLLFTFVGCSNIGKKMPKTLEEAATSSLRTPENTLRDQYRHPVETLEFFGVKPNMTVIEVSPSRGWYTEILAPFLYEKGQYIMAEPETDPRGYTTPRTAWYAKYPHLEKKAKKVVFQAGTKIDLGADNSADMVLTFRNTHNWLPTSNIEEAFKKFHKVLKPGGVLGVVEHRANPKNKFDPKSGYMHEKEIIRIAQKAGFKLAAKSEINANPKDTTKHPNGVWSLPPSLRGGEKDKAKYQAIGESDRMTLKFVK